MKSAFQLVLLVCWIQCSFSAWDQCQYPQLGSAGCKHGGMANICDPDLLLSDSKAIAIQHAVDRVTSVTKVKDAPKGCYEGLSIGIALMESSMIPDLSRKTVKTQPPCVQTLPKMNTTQRSPKEAEKQLMAKEFAKYIKDQWLLNLSPQCETVLIVFYSKEFRRLYMLTSVTADEHLDGDEISEISSRVRHYFEAEQFYDGLEALISQAKDGFKDDANNSKDGFPKWAVGLIVAGLVVAVVAVVVIVVCCCVMRRRCCCCPSCGGSTSYQSPSEMILPEDGCSCFACDCEDCDFGDD